MPSPRTRRGVGLAVAVAAAVSLAVAGCGSSAGLSSPAAPPKAGKTTTNPAAGSMAGMNMGTSTAATAGAIKAVPMQTLGTATWQGMKIQAKAMTAVPFVIFNGTTEKLVKPPKHVSFHLMIYLNDAHTGVVIPYASVWATIKRSGSTHPTVYDERQWPMISEYMGPHYGNNVTLPGAGAYELSLLIGPPVSARHVEYRNVWTKPHRVTVRFNWSPS